MQTLTEIGNKITFDIKVKQDSDSQIYWMITSKQLPDFMVANTTKESVLRELLMLSVLTFNLSNQVEMKPKPDTNSTHQWQECGCGECVLKRIRYKARSRQTPEEKKESQQTVDILTGKRLSDE